MQTSSYIGMDVHKATISISIAEDGRNEPARILKVIPNAPDEIGKTAEPLSGHGQLDCCYEAGGCGYGIYRQLTAMGHSCTVAATSKIPRRPGERIRTDHLALSRPGAPRTSPTITMTTLRNGVHTESITHRSRNDLSSTNSLQNPTKSHRFSSAENP